ncbi:MAG: Multifunctional CCA protein [Lachnoclostridium sp.]
MEITNLNNRIKLHTAIDSELRVKQNLFLDIHKHLLEDERPSVYLNCVSENPLFKEAPFSMLKKLKETNQSPVHHPEGSVWNHTLLVVNEAAARKHKSKDREVFMWAALLHDIGKPDTTRVRKGRITSYDHDTVGEKLTRDFLYYFSCEEEFVDKVANLVRYHMHILYVLKNLNFGNVEKMKQKVDLQELSLLGLCDRLGRLNADTQKEEENIRIFMTKITQGKV